uniref:Uncharacterized protein n=1 Tax=Chipolycivirus sp. TaxID=2809300 RepID=A0AAU8JQI0_9VIRU|nr:MAG: hypothetical protein [Picornavirales sp.]
MFSVTDNSSDQVRFTNNSTSGYLNLNMSMFPQTMGKKDISFNFDIPYSASTEGFYNTPITQLSDSNDVKIASEFEGPVEDQSPNIGEYESGSALGAGVAISILNNQLGSYQTDSLLNKDYLGQGAAGHSFAVSAQEKADSLFEEQQTMIRGGLIAAGSLFGPEGLAVGTAAAGLESAIFSTPPEASISSTSGSDIPSSSVL